MSWFGWLLIAMFSFGALTTVATVGEQRKPISPGVAVIIVVLDALLIIGVLIVGSGSL